MYLSLIICELDIDHKGTDASLLILYTYLEELHKRVPLNLTLPVLAPIEEDSQTYGSDSGLIELANPRSKYIEVCVRFRNWSCLTLVDSNSARIRRRSKSSTANFAFAFASCSTSARIIKGGDAGLGIPSCYFGYWRLPCKLECQFL
jgi:hypothetical protein